MNKGQIETSHVDAWLTAELDRTYYKSNQDYFTVTERAHMDVE